MEHTDLVSSPPTQFAMHSTTYKNNLSFLADMSDPNLSSAGVFPQTTTVSSSVPNSFGVYQLTPVGASDAPIRTLVPINISALTNRKALIAKLFFRQILGYADFPSISVSDLISTVASYFDMSTAMAKREAESASVSIHGSIFNVVNMSIVGFLDSTGKSITISDPNNHPRDVSYFTFRSSLNPNTVNQRAPRAIYQF